MTAIAEVAPGCGSPTESPTPHKRRPTVFTKENARAMAARAAEAKKLKSSPPPTLLPLQPDDPATNNLDPFTLKRLATVRAQMAKLDALIESETDPQKLDRLASAAAKFGELERQYAGRPLPGSYRPATAAKRSIFDSQPERTPTRKAAPALEQETETDRAEQE